MVSIDPDHGSVNTDSRIPERDQRGLPEEDALPRPKEDD